MSMNFSNLIPDIDIGKIINSATSDSAIEIASDSSFANKTLEFSGGQTIYVKVTTDNDGKDNHVLNLRDNNYNPITSYSMIRSGNQFLVNFPAPSSAGIYSLEANVTSAGSVVNLVRTIEVNGEGSNNSQVSVKINNQVNTGNQVLSETDQASPTLTSDLFGQVSPTPRPNPVNGGFFASIWLRIIEFFKGIF